MEFDYKKLLNLLTPANKELVDQGIQSVVGDNRKRRHPRAAMEVPTGEYGSPSYLPDNNPVDDGMPNNDLLREGTEPNVSDGLLNGSETHEGAHIDPNNRPMLNPGVPSDQPVTPSSVPSSPLELQRQKVQGIRDAGVNPGSVKDASGKIIKKKGAPWWKDAISYGVGAIAAGSGDRNVKLQGWNKAMYDKKIAREEGKLDRLQKERQVEDAAQKRGLERRGEIQDQMRDRQIMLTEAFKNDPDWLSFKESGILTDDMVARINKRHGSNLTAKNLKAAEAKQKATAAEEERKFKRAEKEREREFKAKENKLDREAKVQERGAKEQVDIRKMELQQTYKIHLKQYEAKIAKAKAAGDFARESALKLELANLNAKTRKDLAALGLQ